MNTPSAQGTEYTAAFAAGMAGLIAIDPAGVVVDAVRPSAANTTLVYFSVAIQATSALIRSYFSDCADGSHGCSANGTFVGEMQAAGLPMVHPCIYRRSDALQQRR